LTVAAGMYVHALLVTEPMLSVEIKAMSAAVIPAMIEPISDRALALVAGLE